MVKSAISRDWSLFLDRDGVINKRLVGKYICRPEQFEFENGALEAIAGLSRIFSFIVIVTNQQGIGKGLMTEKDLQEVHHYMAEQIEQNGGRIDAVFHCPALAESNHAWRKPNPGMAMAAREKLPGIRFRHSVMAGDSHSDMLFAKKLGMAGILVGNHEDVREETPFDFKFKNLLEFYRAVV